MSIQEIRTYPNKESSSVYVPWITEIIEENSGSIRRYGETEDDSLSSALDEYNKRYANSQEYAI